MADFVSMLVEMGFEKEKAELAVSATGNAGVEPAMEWILSNPDPQPAPKLELSSATTTSPQQPSEEIDPDSEEAVKSYKCEDCGKLFKNAEEMEFHAAKTKHTNFSESSEEKRPLTEEERQNQLKLIEEKIKQKRMEREELEKKEALEKEKMRMKVGKEMGEAKRRFEEQQMKELMEARRREKLEERAARDKVKAQIEADKLTRKAKFSGGSVEPEKAVVVTPVASSTSVAEPAPKKDYTETKLQVRLPSGKSLVQSFGIHEPLAAVRLYVEINRTDGVSGPFNLMTNFPRKVFLEEDYEVPLVSLGLVPSAVLMVIK
ncbi:unnamed protein product [Allacma fusca]|uniref:UBX domain-containing protein 1 n=1 Tax=Allacma fusca TaxID=39272 RepID=A0A8J2NYQ0_9HEXA|nr:unnamed protein product [Allacma fusca]